MCVAKALTAGAITSAQWSGLTHILLLTNTTGISCRERNFLPFQGWTRKFKLYSHVSVFSLFLSFPLAGAAEEPPERPQTSRRWRFPTAEVGFTCTHTHNEQLRNRLGLLFAANPTKSLLFYYRSPRLSVCVFSHAPVIIWPPTWTTTSVSTCPLLRPRCWCECIFYLMRKSWIKKNSVFIVTCYRSCEKGQNWNFSLIKFLKLCGLPTK